MNFSKKIFTCWPLHLFLWGVLVGGVILCSLCQIDSAEIGMPAGEKGAFGGIQKYFYGDYMGTAAPSIDVWSSSDTMRVEFLSDGTTSYFSDITIVPGNTYYYYFKTLTKTEQKNPSVRTIYISSGTSSEVILDGVRYSFGQELINSVTIWHNWGDAPPSPSNITSFWSSDEKFISLEWNTPLFGTDNVMDLTGGGGYEIYRSTLSFDLGSMVFLSSVGAIAGHLSYEDYSVMPGATYYYAVRSYDAYAAPMFSSYSFTKPDTRRSYLTVVFEVDLGDLSVEGGISRVSIVGDFTSPSFYRGRLPMDFAGEGNKWRLSYTDTSLYSGAVIQYKYLINDEIYESDIPVALGGPFRKVVLKSDENTPGRMTLKDVWSVWTPTGTPSNLPEAISDFSAMLIQNNGTKKVRLSWDYDPFSTGSIRGYTIVRSSISSDSTYQIIASTDILSNTIREYLDDVLPDGVTVFYKIASVGNDGTLSSYSDPVKICPPFLIDSAIPIYNLVEDISVFEPGDFYCEMGNNTGEIIVRWNSGRRNNIWGLPSSYLIKYATYPIDNPSAFRRARTAFISRRGISEKSSGYGTTLNLGEDCPSYYFAVCAVYGSWHAVGFSTSVISVAPVVFKASNGVSVMKNSRGFGSVPTSSSTAIIPLAYADVPPNAFPDGKYFMVIRNLNEILNSSSGNVLREKLEEAFSKSATDERFGYIPSNTNPAFSSVFAFDIYDSAKNNYFSKEDGDSHSTSARKDITLALSYEGLDVPPEDLRIGRLNEKGKFWRILKDVKPVIDKNNKLIKFPTKELSVYGLFKSPSPADDLSAVAVYPNPFKPNDNNPATGDYSTGIKFVNLTRNAQVYIYNIAGELVRRAGLDADEYGECRWDVKNDDGEKVASGVYIFVVKDDTVKVGKNQFIGKLGIIR